MNDTNTLAPTDAEILALNAGEVHFSESPSKYPAAGFGTQYHAGAPGVLSFTRAVLAKWGAPASASSEPVAAPACVEPVARIRYERTTPGRENEMPRVLSCNRMADGVYEVFTASQVQAALAAAPSGPIQWCDERDPNESVRYRHVVAESPLRRITVEWKG